MTLLKNYIYKTILGVSLALLYSLVGSYAGIWFLLGWFSTDLVRFLYLIKNFTFRNVQEQFYFLAYSWQRTWVHLFVALDVPDTVVPQNKLVYFFKYADDVIKGDYTGLHFFWWNITYFEMRGDEN